MNIISHALGALISVTFTIFKAQPFEINILLVRFLTIDAQPETSVSQAGADLFSDVNQARSAGMTLRPVPGIHRAARLGIKQPSARSEIRQPQTASLS